MINPFSGKTPEALTAQDIATLFIDVFSDFPKVLEANHTFIHGSRGTGKSMMLRYLEPAVQKAADKIQKIQDLKFFAIYVPIKTHNYNISELDRLKDSAYWLHSEHFFITSICHTIITKLIALEPDNGSKELQKFLQDATTLINMFTATSYEQIYTLEDLELIFKKEKIATRRYLKSISFAISEPFYQGAIFDFEEFFLEFIRMVKHLSFTPDGPLFLMVDDADNLTIKMQKVLNTWVSYRTTNDLCLKIATQKKYKTWRTIQGALIESPHDFTEIDINAIYTSKQHSTYHNRIEKIIEKRLEIAKITATPYEFFPIDKIQEENIKTIKQEIATKWDAGERISSRKQDDLTRYAVSEYMRQLEANKKSNTYSYAGFDELVNISSGMIRYFLEPASRMFSELESQGIIDYSVIPIEIQNRVIKKWSEEYVVQDFEKMRNDESCRSNEEQHETKSTIPKNEIFHLLTNVEKLKNLLESLGICFRKKLLSNDTERRFLSFMLTKSPSKELQDILDLAIEWGYLSLSSISKKEGSGRNQLYTLNRRLAPYYKLDPTGYAAHLSITPEQLLIGLTNPNKFVVDRLKLNKTADKVQNTLNLDM